MTKLKAWLSAAGALVVGGTALTLALQDSRESLGMDCKELSTLLRQAEQSRQDVTYYVAVQDGYMPPQAFQAGEEHRMLGAVEGTGASGELVVEDESCPGAPGYRYQYKRALSVNGWSLYMIDGDRYFARSWQLLAGQQTAVAFLGGFSQVVDACLARFTAAQCRDALGQVSACWRLGDGQLCRYYDASAGEGRLYGPGVGGDQACILDVDARPYPCRDRGRGLGWAERAVNEALDLTEE